MNLHGKALQRSCSRAAAQPQHLLVAVVASMPMQCVFCGLEQGWPLNRLPSENPKKENITNTPIA